MDFRFLLLLLILSSTQYIVGGRENPTILDSGKNIIQAKDVANEFDCVDLYKQPAFSHPSLKNHKIQMNPSFSAGLERNEVPPFKKVEFGVRGEDCPPGKVPIQRNRYDNQDFHQFSQTNLGQHFATIQTVWQTTEYHGARAIIQVYNPQVVYPQVSAAYIWVRNGPSSELNNIEFGWAVNPRLYGDNETRFTGYWTADNYKSSCYNVQCPGFVQLHPYYHLGQKIGNTSIYGGDQFVIDLRIKQDQSTGNWWLIINGTENVGYWPKEIFNHLNEGATFVQYGGWTFISPDGVSPPMGSGSLPTINYKTSSFFAQIKIVDSSYNEGDIKFSEMKEYSDTSNRCYNVQYWGYQGKNLQQTFAFGGPGGPLSSCGT